MKAVNEQIVYELFDNTFSAVTADSDQLKRDIMEKYRLSAGKNRKSRRLLPLKIVLASILVLALSVTTYAAAIGGFEALMERISLPFEQVVEPVSIVKEDQGIRLEVLAAQCYNDEAVLYVTLQDMTDQGRIDETTDLSGDIINGQYTSYSSTGLDYDEETGIAAFEIRIHSDNFEESLSVDFNKIYTIIHTVEPEPIVIDVEAHLQETGNPALRETRGHAADFLESVQLAKIPGTQDAYLSAVGISDGWFCVQATAPKNSGYHLWPHLKEADGTIVEPYSSVSSIDADGISEYYFDVDVTRLSDYDILFEGTQAGIMKGDWSVSVDISNPDQTVSGTGWYENKKFFNEDVENKNGTVSGEITVTLNPLGLTVTGGSNLFGAAMEEAEVKTTEGSMKLEFVHGYVKYTEEQLASDEPPSLDDAMYEAYYQASAPVDLDTVLEVWVDGNLIWEKES